MKWSRNLKSNKNGNAEVNYKMCNYDICVLDKMYFMYNVQFKCK